MLNRSRRVPVAIVLRQRSAPVRRSIACARSVSLVASADDTNTRSPETIGVAALVPGRFTLHATFAVFDQSRGRPVSGEEPLKSGPRQWRHSAADAHSPDPSKAQATNQVLGIRTVMRCFTRDQHANGKPIFKQLHCPHKDRLSAPTTGHAPGRLRDLLALEAREDERAENQAIDDDARERHQDIARRNGR